MVDAEPVRQQLVLRRDHVVVVVLRKACAQSVAGLAGLAVSNVVGQDDEVAIHVEQLPRTEQHTGKLGLRN